MATMVQRPMFHRQNMDSRFDCGESFPMGFTLMVEMPAVNAAGRPFVEFPAVVVELSNKGSQTCCIIAAR